MATSVKEKTFQYQSTLPNLPVPSLRQTIDKYLDSVKPHVTAEQYENTCRLAKEFENGIGQNLQRDLIEKGRVERNWLEKWWEDYAYLSARSPIWPISNFGGAGPRYQQWPPKLGTQTERAAIITYWVLRYWDSLQKYNYPPTEEIDVQRSRKVVWDMNQTYRIFNSCRIPGEHKDYFCHYFKTVAEGSSPSHIVAMYRGQFWKINTYDKAGRIFTPPQLEKIFETLLLAGRASNGSNISALTCGNRIDWWKERERLLLLSPENRNYFQAIESSILIVSFSDETPSNDTELAKYSISGDPRCQYADKSFVWHFFKNGMGCTSGEHGNMDAVTMILLNIFVDDNVMKNNFKWEPNEMDNLPGPNLVELRFVVDKQTKKSVETAMEIYRPLAEDLDILVWHFSGYGTKFFKEHKLYGDTVVQVAMQLAYFKLYNTPVATYETATTRRYYHGRTETVRSCTTECVEFSKIMLNPKSSLQAKHEFLWKAIKKHDQLMADAMNAQGCDRHLLGLRLLAAEKGLPDPAMFQDPSWKLSGGDGNFRLSTSFVGYSIVFGGVSPMCANGYGTFYKMMTNDITFFLCAWKSSKQTDLKLWNHSINWALCRIGEILSISKL